jgi:HAD superfamily hydrolase (TIGR01490 family)
MKMQIGAFFDIDKTVLEVNSGTKWVGYQWRNGKMNAWQVGRALTWLVQYRFGLLDFDAMAARILESYAGRPVDPIAREVERWFHAEVAGEICHEARQQIEQHRQQGHVVALLTSATRFLSQPVATVLEVPHVLCTEVEIDDGIITGRCIEPACYGPGKVVRAEAFAAAHDIDLDRSYFYTDSYSDLPMLERVGEPRVVNPDPRLRRKAAERGWGYETWRAVRRANEGVEDVGSEPG